MINIKELKKEDVGRWVRYETSHGSRELGRIKSWNTKYIFVVYKCDCNWERFEDYTGCSTKPEDLTFIEKG